MESMHGKLLIAAILCSLAALFSGNVAAGDMAESPRSVRAINSVSPTLEKELALAGLNLGSPVFLRVIKSPRPHQGPLHDGVLEIYLQGADGRYQLFKTKDICAASGLLGPKTRMGDEQSPEGFYFVNAARFNPWSSYHLSLNLGYPNRFDRAHGYTGNFLMIHGNCVSVGCFAMTDDGIDEIYTLAQAAIKGGQGIIRVHAFPFPMTQANMELAENSPHIAFWRNLKQGWDWFETNGAPPNVTVENLEYAFGPIP